MADKKTVAELEPLVEELVDLFSDYFIITKCYVGDKVRHVDVNEYLETTEFVKYDYKAVYKKIDEVLEKIKGIDSGVDSGSDSFILSDEETKRVIDDALMTMFGRD